ncbi:hypothetical protein O181_074067 [Austropuccinia psidii MF-1]|uniref:Uncharacterized protein n=1 Tax=Austropuccinia psidii MF-1 TaxID=1389203 RepID=A0A9Q3FA83_9BASI|nr:hypothetical protein [Austropuccinia psidii MF-1]
MLAKDIGFYTAYHPQTDVLAERMVQTTKDIIRRFCAYGMEYKDHEGYTHDCPTGNKRVEPPITCGSPEENSSDYPPKIQRLP